MYSILATSTIAAAVTISDSGVECDMKRYFRCVFYVWLLGLMKCVFKPCPELYEEMSFSAVRVCVCCGLKGKHVSGRKTNAARVLRQQNETRLYSTGYSGALDTRSHQDEIKFENCFLVMNNNRVNLLVHLIILFCMFSGFT